MGLFKKLKKAFKKITSKVKKVVKKVVKKIGSSKILKAIAIAGAAIVTGGAALGAFGGTGALATSKFGTWMMGASQKALGGSVFSGSGVLSKVGNFAVKTAAKPFGAVGGALGSTARVGANILTGQSAFAAGPAVGAPVPFSGAALSGQMNTENIYYDEQSNMFMDNSSGSPVPLTRDEVARLPESFTKLDDFGIPQGANTLNEAGEVVTATADAAQSTGLREFGRTVGTSVATNVATGAIMAKITETDPTGTSVGAGGQERAGAFDPLRIYASENNINVSDIYNQALYGNADPSSMYGSQLYSQETIEVA
tara:strand:- start:937 stop:1869 length:933 start_codon:yes stop_codon:yes gene_type:complete